MNIVAVLYSWAVAMGLYSAYLDAFLQNSQVGTNYVLIFLISLAITLLSLIVFYIFPGRPSWAKNRYWFITMGISAILNFWMSSQWTLQNKLDDLTATINPTTGQPENQVSDMDCWMFGVSDTLLFIVIFIFLSFLVRLFSNNLRYIPHL